MERSCSAMVTPFVVRRVCDLHTRRIGFAREMPMRGERSE